MKVRQWLHIDDLHRLPEPQWLVQDVLAADGFTSLYGREGIGKSFVALSLALSVAAGLDWHDRRVTQAPVVYVAGEGAHTLRPRINAWAEQHPAADLSRFHLDPNPLQLLDPADCEAFEQTRHLHLDPGVPMLVVLDTLSRCITAGGGDENSPKTMTAAVAAIDRLRSHGSSVLVVHHANKSGGERGHSAFSAAADTRIEVTPGPTLTCRKQRNDAPFDPVRLRLEKHRDSCVLQRVGVTPADAAF